MPLGIPDLSPHSQALAAVVTGAVLATASGVVATQLEAFFKRRERERLAALLFGEVLSALEVILATAAQARRQGDPFGPITRRTLRAARREIEVYDRNREALYDLRDADLRVNIHALMVRMAMPLEGILDGAEAPGGAAAESLDQGFDFLMEMAGRLPGVVARLGKIARHGFEQYGRLRAEAARDTDSALPSVRRPLPPIERHQTKTRGREEEGGGRAPAFGDQAHRVGEEDAAADGHDHQGGGALGGGAEVPHAQGEDGGEHGDMKKKTAIRAMAETFSIPAATVRVRARLARP